MRQVLELFKKGGTVANHGAIGFRFRNRRLYPAELRDSNRRGGRGALKLHISARGDRHPRPIPI